MSEKYIPSVGDRVRVILEGGATHVESGCFRIDGRNAICPDADQVVSIERLGPNLPTTPGSVVRVGNVTLMYEDDGCWYDQHGADVYARDLASRDFAVIFDAEETK